METRVPTWIVASMLVAGCGHSPLMSPPPEAPAIVCPADMTVHGVTGGGRAVTFAAPTTSGGTVPLTVTCTPASGATFTTGETPVACTVLDGQGRQASCAFAVKLTPVVLDVTRFIAFGDSVTAGENGRPGLVNTFIDFPNLYPIELEQLLNAEYPDQGIVVINRGFGGDSVERSVEKLPGVLEADHGGALLLLDGYNNLLAECTPGQSGTPACARKIARRGGRAAAVHPDREGVGVRHQVHVRQHHHAAGAVRWRAPRSSDRRRRCGSHECRRWRAWCRPRVRSSSTRYGRFLGHETEYIDQDGLHLRPAGYEALAGAFFDAIKSNVTGTAALRSR